MPKLLANPFRELSLAAFTSKHENMLNQPVRTFDNVEFQDIMVRDLMATGNVTFTGNISEIVTERVQIKDNIIDINQGNLAPLLNGGFTIQRGPDLEPFQILYSEEDRRLKLGFPSTMQSVATREDNPLNEGMALWDAENNIFKTTYAYPRPFKFNTHLQLGGRLQFDAQRNIDAYSDANTIHINSEKVSIAQRIDVDPTAINLLGPEVTVHGQVGVHGNAQFQQDLHVAGRLTVDSAVVSPPRPIPVLHLNALDANMDEPVLVVTNHLRTVYITLRVTPQTVFEMVELHVALPDRTAHFTNALGNQGLLNSTCSGYVDEDKKIVLYNCICVAQPGTASLSVRFQASEYDDVHVIQFSATYTTQ